VGARGKGKARGPIFVLAITGGWAWSGRGEGVVPEAMIIVVGCRRGFDLVRWKVRTKFRQRETASVSVQ